MRRSRAILCLKRAMRRSTDYLMALLLLAALTLAATWLARNTSSVLAGPAYAIDGDTLAFGPDHVRLLGLDAPELDQTCERGGTSVACGKAAQAGLSAMLTPALRCESSGHDVYGRILAHCSTDKGDIGERLVEAGLALNKGCCLAAEVRARAARRGVWAGRLEAPADWRRAHDARRS